MLFFSSWGCWNGQEVGKIFFPPFLTLMHRFTQFPLKLKKFKKKIIIYHGNHTINFTRHQLTKGNVIIVIMKCITLLYFYLFFAFTEMTIWYILWLPWYIAIRFTKGKAPDKQGNSGACTQATSTFQIKTNKLMNKWKARNDTNVGPDCKFIFILHF